MCVGRVTGLQQLTEPGASPRKTKTTQTRTLIYRQQEGSAWTEPAHVLHRNQTGSVYYQWITYHFKTFGKLKGKLCLIFLSICSCWSVIFRYKNKSCDHTFIEKGRNEQGMLGRSEQGMLVQLSGLMSHCVICKVTCSCKHRQPSVVWSCRISSATQHVKLVELILSEEGKWRKMFRWTTLNNFMLFTFTESKRAGLQISS